MKSSATSLVGQVWDFLFLGASMDFSFTDEQKAIRELSEKILEEKVTQDSLNALDKKGLWFHEEAWKTLAEVGAAFYSTSRSLRRRGL